jgi:hypothetical protein
MRTKTISVTGLIQSAIYRPLALFLAIMLMPVFSSLDPGSGPKLFQASAQNTTPTNTTPPTAPSSLTLTADSFTILGQFNFNGLILNWAASADPYSPTITYHVERDLVTTSETGWSEITTTTSTSYEDTDQILAATLGSPPTLTAFYRVRAADASGNYSGYSNPVQYPRSTGGSIHNAIFQSFVPCVANGCFNFGYTPDLIQLESDSVNAYLAGHNLPGTDGHIVYDFGRTDLRDAIRGEMLTILVGIINKPATLCPTSTPSLTCRTTHEQNLYNWLQGLVQANEIALYTAAISEYNAWYVNPCNFTLNSTIASAVGATYDGSPWCQLGSIIPPSPTVPPEKYFIGYGMTQSYAQSAQTYSNFPSIVADTAVNVTEVAGIFAAAGVVLSAVATGVLATSFGAAAAAFATGGVITFLTGSSVPLGTAFLSSAFTLSGSSIAAIGGVAVAAAGVAAIILIGVAIGVAALIELLDYTNTISDLNNMSTTLSTVTTTPPDLTAFLDSTGQYKLNQTLASQTLPDVPSTATLPAHQSTDLIFGITPQSSTQTTSSTLSYMDWNGVSWLAQTYGGWFVQTCTGFVSPATACPQTDSIIASIRYVDWGGLQRTASRIGANFVITTQNPASADTNCPADATAGVTLAPGSSCWSYVSAQIQLTAPGGTQETVILTNQAPTTTTISASTITYNGNGSVTVTVTSPAGTPTGNVSLTVDSGTATSQELDGSGSAVFSITSPNTGGHTLSASYAAQNGFASSGSTGNLQVNTASTTASIGAPPVTYNANGSVAVTVSSTAGTPTGSASLSVDSGSPITQALDGTGTAMFTIPSPSAGNHTLSASYAAQGNFAAINANGTLQVSPGGTGITIGAPTVTYPANGAIVVQMTSTAGVPTGNVSLSVDGGAATAMPVDGTGKAQFTISNPGVGNHTLSASYALQGNFATSAGTGTLLVIAPTTLSISAPPVTYNTNGLVTLMVTSPSGTPTGNVSLSVDGAPAISQPLNGSAQATFTITSPGAGPHSLSASYSGNFNPTNGTGSLNVNLSPTATSITSGLTAATVTGQGYSVGVHVGAVAPGAGTPTGTVTVNDGSSSCVALLSGGSGTCTLTSTTAGMKTITAIYNSDGNYLSTSITGTHTVSLAATGLIVSSSETPSTFGDSVILTASLSVKTPGSGTPTGTVSWTIDGKAAGTGSTLTIATLAVGPHTVAAAYSGDSNFVGSSGNLATGQIVNTHPVTATLSAPAQEYSDQETFTLSVPNVMVNGQTAAAAGTVVTFNVGTQKIGACALTASGGFNTCSVTTALIEPSATAAGVPTGTAPNGQMAPGNHTVSVSYTVDPNFLVTGNGAVLPIAQENATSVYTGNTFYSVGSATKGTIALSATIEDGATSTSDPAYGDIRNARVTFIDRLTGNVFSGCANLPVGLISSSNSTLGSASCTTTAAVGSYQVATLVGYSNASTANEASYYTDNNPSEDTNLTVAQSGAGFIIGGGFLQLTSASGQLNPTNGGAGVQSHQDFGFFVATTKGKTTFPGSLSAIVRSQKDLHGNACSVTHPGHSICVYQVNAPAIGSLTIAKAPNAACPANAPNGSECASFTATGVIKDITLPFSSTTVDGDATMIVNMVDASKQSGDMISFQINADSSKGGGLWYSSNWTGTRTVEQGLAGGNLSVQ